MKGSCLAVLLVLTGVLNLGAVGCDGQTTAGTSVLATTSSAPVSTSSAPVSASSASSTTTTPPAMATWADLRPSGDVPAARAGHSMVYDPVSGKVILFGGWAEADFNDTWAYDPATNTWADLLPSGDVPAARHDHAMTYDVASGKVILFGGIEKSTYLELDDTWAYDPSANAWTELNPEGDLPASRCLHALVYDPGTKKVVLYGGSRRGGCLGDVWTYDPATNAWTDVTPTGGKPLARYGTRVVYDPDLGRVLLFGGSDGHLLGDTWSYDPAGDAWTDLIPVDSTAVKPPARQFHTMAYDSEGKRTILFGGCGVTALGDAWAYESSANSWTALVSQGAAPSARAYSSMAYAADAGVLIVFGGSEDVAPFKPAGDTWSCDATP